MSNRLLPGSLAAVMASIAIASVILGASPIFLWAIGTLVVASVMARYMRWAAALASALIALCFYLLMLTRLATFATTAGVTPAWLLAMSAPALIGTILLFLTEPRVTRARIRDSLPAFAALLMPAAVALVSVVAVFLRFGFTHLSWSMNRDAITSMVFARFLFEDGGVSAERPNPLLLPYGLIAAALVPGRDGLQANEYLEHDVARMAGLWLVIVGVTSILAGLVALTTIPVERPVIRITATLIAGAVPLSWYVAGSAFAFGFFNATMTIVLLLASWLVWRDSSSRPEWSVSLLLVASTVLLATWSPFAVVTAALALSATWLHWRHLMRESPRSVIVVAAAAVQLLAWGCLVTIPDFLRDGQYLGSGGAIFDSSPIAVALIAVVAVIVCLLSARRGDRSLDRIGIFVILAASAPLLIYFLSFRLGTDDVWTYFPAKFSWLVSSFLLILIVAMGGRALAVAKRSAVWRVIAATASVLLVGIMFWAVPLTQGLSDLYPGFAIWRSTSISENDPYVRTAFDLSSPLETNLVVRYNGVAGDYFANAWLLQANIESMEDPVRQYAYSFFAWDAADACDVVEELGKPVTIWTRDAALSAELSSNCPDADYTVRLETG